MTEKEIMWTLGFAVDQFVNYGLKKAVSMDQLQRIEKAVWSGAALGVRIDGKIGGYKAEVFLEDEGQSLKLFEVFQPVATGEVGQ
jgi:hypothetical protein